MLNEKDLERIENYLISNVSYYLDEKNRLLSVAKKREENGLFSIEDYIEGMIRSLLTNSVPWSRISPNINNGSIKRIFKNYNPAELKESSVDDIVKELRLIKCGNRSDRLQIGSLKTNIEILEKIIKEYGSFEKYLMKTCSRYPIINYEDLHDFDYGGKYKLGGMGIPLICEFLKNMGFDLPKPDVHLKRMLSSDRAGHSIKKIANNNEVFSQINKLSDLSKIRRSVIDLILWCFCAKGYGEICGAKPLCKKCIIHNTPSCSIKE